jgi:hypothetical protein
LIVHITKQSNWCLGWKLWFWRLTLWIPASLWLISVPIQACLKARVGLKHPLTCRISRNVLLNYNTQDSWILCIMSADILLDSECVVPGSKFPWMQRNTTVWQYRLVFVNNLCNLCKYQLYTQFIFLYMFWATKCSSSGESDLSVWPLVYVTVCR